MSLTVSIVTVVYNNADYISPAIESVLAQDYPYVEFVVIDGGSTDGTLEKIKKFQGQISILVSEPDQGIYDALNKGISLSSGDVVGLLHSDDFFENNSVISSIMNYFNGSAIDVVYGDLDYVSTSDTSHVVRHWRAGEFKKDKLKYGWMPPHPALFVSREMYKQLGGFDLSYRISSDYDLILKMLSKAELRVVYHPEVLVKMRLGGESNRTFSNIIQKSMEDYRVLKNNKMGGILALVWKNLGKLPQFIYRA